MPGLFVDPALLETKSARPKRSKKRAVEDIALGVTEGRRGR